MKRLVLCLLLALAAGPLSAAEKPPADSRDRLQIVLEQQREIQADVDGGRFEGLSPRQANAVRKAQKEVFAVTAGKQSLDQLSMDEKIRLENALERINAEIVDTRSARDDQDVCWRERVSGTGMKKTRCGTQAEMREAREGARGFLERPKVCGENCSGL